MCVCVSVVLHISSVCDVLVHLIVATPGRILDLLNKNLIKTDDCKVLILDEVLWLILLLTKLTNIFVHLYEVTSKLMVRYCQLKGSLMHS